MLRVERTDGRTGEWDMSTPDEFVMVDIQDRKTVFSHIRGNAPVTESVTINGPELQYVLHRFTFNPRLNSEVKGEALTWWGDMAKFIVGNL